MTAVAQQLEETDSSLRRRIEEAVLSVIGNDYYMAQAKVSEQGLHLAFVRNDSAPFYEDTFGKS